MRGKTGSYQKLLRTCLAVVGGNIFLAFGIAAFVIPQGIIMGGATGIGIVLSRHIPLETATIVLILNLLALVLGGVVLGKQFLLTTVASSMLYPLFLGIVQRIPGIDTLTDSLMLSALFGGGIVGISLGLVMRVGASTGGMDVVNLVLHKCLHLPVSVLVYITDIFILGAQALTADPEQILYGIVLLIVETAALNRVMLLGQSQIQLFVVSSRYEEIRQRCLTDLQAGTTMVHIETGRTRTPQRGVLCVIPPRKLYAAQTLVQSVDPNAFLTISQIKEVRGQGFSRERTYVEPPPAERPAVGEAGQGEP